jgi:hypothetical protein
MPASIVRLTGHPAIGRYFNSPEPIHLDSFLSVYEREILSKMDQRMLTLNDRIPRTQYSAGVLPRVIDVPLYTLAKSSESQIVDACRLGEDIVYRGQVGKIVKVRGNGFYDIEVQKVRVPPIDSIIRADSSHFTDIKSYFGQLGISHEHFRVMNKIMSHVGIGNKNYALQLTMSHRKEDNTFLKEARLGMVRIESPDVRHEVTRVTNRAARIFTEYCARARPIVRAVENRQDLQMLDAFNGGEEQAHEFRKWIAQEVAMNERPNVEQTLAEESIRAIARVVNEIEPEAVVEYDRVPEKELIRKIARVPFTGEVRWERPYISIDMGSFGAVGFIVGYSKESRTAAFVQQTESERFTTFGGFLARPVGIVTTLDCLCPLGG